MSDETIIITLKIKNGLFGMNSNFTFLPGEKTIRCSSGLVNDHLVSHIRKVKEARWAY